MPDRPLTPGRPLFTRFSGCGLRPRVLGGLGSKPVVREGVGPQAASHKGRRRYVLGGKAALGPVWNVIENFMVGGRSAPLFLEFPVFFTVLSQVVPVSELQSQNACARSASLAQADRSHRFGEPITRLVITKVVRASEPRGTRITAEKQRFFAVSSPGSGSPLPAAPPLLHTAHPLSGSRSLAGGFSMPDSSGGLVRFVRRSSIHPNPLASRSTLGRACVAAV